jgi:hypothetical protein
MKFLNVVFAGFLRLPQCQVETIKPVIIQSSESSTSIKFKSHFMRKTFLKKYDRQNEFRKMDPYPEIYSCLVKYFASF